MACFGLAPRHPSMALMALPLLGLVLSLGCDDPEQLRSLDLAELPERFACQDVTVVAANLEGSEALMIGVEDGLAAAALASGEAIEAQYALPDDRLIVRWVEGSNVYEGHCGRDSGGKWRLDERREAISGTISVRITPDPEGKLTLSAQLDELLLVPLDDADAPVYELEATHLDGLHVDP